MDLYSQFNVIAFKLLTERNLEEDLRSEFSQQYMLNEEVQSWLFSLNEEKEVKNEILDRLMDKINKAIANRQQLSFGPAFPTERTYFDLHEKPTKEEKELVAPKEISDFLITKGYEVSDYKKGIASKRNDSKRIIKIGKLISSDARLKKIFDERLSGKLKTSNNLQVVFTYNPEDIIKMSTGRGWTSCADLNKVGIGEQETPAAHQIPSKIQYGGMVAYLIFSNDKEIKNPIARIAIRRFINDEDGTFALLPEKKCYGSSNKTFSSFVSDKLDENNKITINEKYGIYNDAEDGYSDSFDLYHDFKDPKLVFLDKLAGNRNPSAEDIREAEKIIKSLNKDEMNKPPSSSDSPIPVVISTAIIYANLPIIKLFLNNGLNIHFDNDKMLRAATYYARLDQVKLAVNYGADIHVNKEEPLFNIVGAYVRSHSEEVRKQALETTRYLLENGANVNKSDRDLIKYSRMVDDNDELYDLLQQHKGENS
jgi:hypothetical protein